MNPQNQELTNRLMTQAALAFAALAFYMVVLAALSGCNPYEDLYPSRTPAPSMTATVTSTSVASYDRATPRPSCVVVTGVPAGNLNIRSGPGTQHAVIGLAREGDTLTLLEHYATHLHGQGTWAEVETAQHVTGWVNGRYCK